MKVKEVMTKELISIKPNGSAKDALDLLFKMHISGLPVIDEEGKLVGMFTEKDVLTYILPSYIDKVGRFVYDENPKSIKKKFLELGNIRVSQLMRRDVITTAEDASCCEVARIMLTQNVRRIPVLNKEKKVVGIITREDIIKSYAKEAGWGTD
ncbi:MAG: CBS domain-containing protein [Candidatus Omnitrophica bacterium]|nr:CBS domain-containing protein [Candidatus Omnitrophota bacterium]